MIYYYSIKQQERSYFRQILVRVSIFTSRQPSARHAYLPLLLAVKTKRPHFFQRTFSIQFNNSKMYAIFMVLK